MQKVKVNKNMLILTLKKNKEEHEENFLRAEQGYRKKVIEKLEELLLEAKAGGKICTKIDLAAPFNHIADYERVLRMLEMSVDDDIEITSMDFEQYIMDNWQWKAPFMNLLNTYTEEK